MPAPSVFGLASGQDHNDTIKKLMYLERIPIRRMEKSARRMRYRAKAWKNVRQLVRKLADKSRTLYSFLGPFTMKSVVSDDPDVISGEASASVQIGEQSIHVLQLATHHQLHSRPLDSKLKLRAGRFSISIGEHKYNFRFPGGTPARLEKLMASRGKDHFIVIKINVDGKRVMLGLRSKISGKKGSFRFVDKDGLLQRIGLVKIADGDKQWIDIDIANSDLTSIKRKKGTPVTARHEVIDGGSGLNIEGRGAVKLKKNLLPGTELRFNIGIEKAKVKVKKERDERTTGQERSESVTYGPDIDISVGDVHLKGYNIKRSRTIRDKVVKKKGVVQRSGGGIGIIWEKNGREVRKELFWNREKAKGEKIVDISKITGGKKAKGIYFFAEGDARAVFRNLKITNPTAAGAGRGLVAAHETSPPRDAKFKIHGVELSRSGNKGLTDIIEGVSLNLHKTSSEPVNVRVEANTVQITKRIKEWVEAYNSLLKFCYAKSRSDVSARIGSAAHDEPGRNFETFMEKTGVFAAESTIRGLLAIIREVTALAYPSMIPNGFRLLSDIGISTGAIGFSNFNSNRQGYLKVDEDRLKEALKKSSVAVKEIFASDTNADARIDNGVAYQLGRRLRPYERSSGGMISTRIQLLNQQIADNKKRISRKELSLKKTEAKMRRKFGSMETAIRRSNATRNFLKIRLPGFGSERKN